MLSFIIANGHLIVQLLQFNINIINTVNKKKQYQHSGSYLPWYRVAMPYFWAGLPVLSLFFFKTMSALIASFTLVKEIQCPWHFSLSVWSRRSINRLIDCGTTCWSKDADSRFVTEWLGNWTSANGMACLIRNAEEGPYIIVTEFPIKHLHLLWKEEEIGY